MIDGPPSRLPFTAISAPTHYDTLNGSFSVTAFVGETHVLVELPEAVRLLEVQPGDMILANDNAAGWYRDSHAMGYYSGILNPPRNAFLNPPKFVTDSEGDVWVRNSEEGRYEFADSFGSLQELHDAFGINSISDTDPTGPVTPEVQFNWTHPQIDFENSWGTPDSWPNENTPWVFPPEIGVKDVHPLTQRFIDTLNQMEELHLRKGADYGRDEDPFANVRASEDFGIPGWVGCMTRANDKMRRLMKAASGGEMANESVEDSLLDLAVYAVIGYVLYTEQAEKDGEARLQEIYGDPIDKVVVTAPGDSEADTSGNESEEEIFED